MGEWTCQVLGEPISLSPDEQDAVAAEIGRLRSLMHGVSGDARVQVTRNPSGLAGEYASLLIEAAVRGYPAEAVVPTEIVRRYVDCHWFVISQEVLSAFREQWAAVRAASAEPAMARSRS